MMRWLLVFLLIAPITVQSADIDWQNLNMDPLRRYVPDPKLFMPVPGGRMAARVEAAEDDSFEDKADSRNGGLVMGFCLISSCSWITHIVVEQVCSNTVGGKGKADKLILGIIKMPRGKRPGFLKSLTGRNYAENFQLYGPYEQILTNEKQANYKVAAVGVGPVAPLEYEGLEPKKLQNRATRTFQLDFERDVRIFEVRHLCKSPLS